MMNAIYLEQFTGHLLKHSINLRFKSISQMVRITIFISTVFIKKQGIKAL